MTTRNDTEPPTARPAAAGRSPPLTDEERRKYDELVASLEVRVREGERMTPEERAKADAEWEKFKQSMNEPRKGYRLLYVD